MCPFLFWQQHGRKDDAVWTGMLSASPPPGQADFKRGTVQKAPGIQQGGCFCAWKNEKSHQLGWLVFLQRNTGSLIITISIFTLPLSKFETSKTSTVYE